MVARFPKIFGVGALKPEDRLLVVTDGEHGTKVRPTCTEPIEVIVGQRLDDLPLCDVRILRLVDENMVEASVQFVPDPACHPGVRQQARRLGDQIVEIDYAFPALRLVPAKGESAPGLQLRRYELREFDCDLAVPNTPKCFGQNALLVFKHRVELYGPAHRSRIAVLFQRSVSRGKAIQFGKTPGRAERHPFLDESAAFSSALRIPPLQCRQHSAHRVHREIRIAA